MVAVRAAFPARVDDLEVSVTPGDYEVFLNEDIMLKCNVEVVDSSYKCRVCGTQIGGCYLYDPSVGTDHFHPVCAALVAMCP